MKVSLLSQYSFDDEYLYFIGCSEFLRKTIIIEAYLNAKQCGRV